MDAAVESSSVFLLAQNRLLREALAKIMQKKTDLQVVGACAFSPGVLEQIAESNPDVLLMDSFTTGLSHLQFIHEVQCAVPPIKVLLIGMDTDEQAFLQAVREGAVGYVLQDASALEVVAALRSVMNGEAVCPPQLCSCLFRYVARHFPSLPSYQAKVNLGLTNREQQLMLLIARGLTNKEIASQLNLAEQTVRNHVHRMLRKVGASNRFAAVEMCRMQGLPV
jgi:DNA-binding NarL/FixJ family response regulator